MKRSLRMSFCLRAATTLQPRDLDALTVSIERYMTGGASTVDAEKLAVHDALADLHAERESLRVALREQHPELFARSTSSPGGNPSTTQSAATQPRPPSGGRNLRKSLQANDPFRAFLGEFGLNLELRSDFAPSATEQRKAMAMGYGPIFRRGGLSLDVAAQYAQERGFLAPGGEASATEMYDLVKSMMRGEKIAPQFTNDFEARMRAEADRRFDDSQGGAEPVNDYPGWSDEDVAEAEAERAAIMADSGLTPAAAADYPDDAPWNFASTASTEEADRKSVV